MTLHELRPQMSPRQRKTYDEILQAILDLKAEIEDPSGSWTDQRLTNAPQSSLNPKRVGEGL